MKLEVVLHNFYCFVSYKTDMFPKELKILKFKTMKLTSYIVWNIHQKLMFKCDEVLGYT